MNHSNEVPVPSPFELISSFPGHFLTSGMQSVVKKVRTPRGRHHEERIRPGSIHKS